MVKCCSVNLIVKLAGSHKLLSVKTRISLAQGKRKSLGATSLLGTETRRMRGHCSDHVSDELEVFFRHGLILSVKGLFVKS